MTAANIAPFIRGAHHLVARPDGLARPSRLSDKQVDAAAAEGRARAARACAGVTIGLETTGDEVSFDLSVLGGCYDAKAVTETLALVEERGAAAGEGLSYVGEAAGVLPTRGDALGSACNDSATALDENGTAPLAVDAVDLYVDGVFVRSVPVRSGAVTLSFSNPAHAPAEVCVYLPNLASVAVGNLATNGSLALAPKRGYLLALGDSITQGYVVGSPGLSWPARVARACGLDLVNQAIAGHHFDARTLKGMRLLRENPPTLVVVAYGTNDWAHAESKRELVKNCAKYLERVAEMFPDTPVYVLSPIWRADEDESRGHGKSLDWVRKRLYGECARLGLRYVEGSTLVPADTALFADGRLHPNAEGAAHLAEGVLGVLERDGVLAVLGGRRDSPVARADAQSRLRAAAPGQQREFEEVCRTIWRLRQPDGCPWDKVQTHESIKKNMIEEAYEAVDCIEGGDARHLCEELGDVLMQVLLHAQIAADAGEFTIADVCRGLDEKLVRRHPHVFGAHGAAGSASEVLDIWSSVKLEERRAAADGAAAPDAVEAPAAPASGLLDAVPRALPALMQAQKVSKKAAACGFEWETTADVWRKVAEERGEFEAEEAGSSEAAEEFGDMLFAFVNVARHEGIDAEMALRASCEKFRSRWAHMEREAAATGLRLEDCPHDKLEEMWMRAKADLR